MRFSSLSTFSWLFLFYTFLWLFWFFYPFSFSVSLFLARWIEPHSMPKSSNAFLLSPLFRWLVFSRFVLSSSFLFILFYSLFFRSFLLLLISILFLFHFLCWSNLHCGTVVLRHVITQEAADALQHYAQHWSPRCHRLLYCNFANTNFIVILDLSLSRWFSNFHRSQQNNIFSVLFRFFLFWDTFFQGIWINVLVAWEYEKDRCKFRELKFSSSFVRSDLKSFSPFLRSSHAGSSFSFQSTGPCRKIRLSGIVYRALKLIDFLYWKDYNLIVKSRNEGIWYSMGIWNFLQF